MKTVAYGPFVRPSRFQRLRCWLWLCSLRLVHYNAAGYVYDCPFCGRGAIQRRDGSWMP